MDMGIMSVTKSYRYEYYTNQAAKVKGGEKTESVEDLFGKREENVPYGYLAKDGVINYRGVMFVCDEENNRLCLGDVSDPDNCITVNLSNGGHLVFNRNNIGALSEAISMFSPEDISRIMKAIAEDAKSKQVKNEIEEEEAETVGGIAESASGVTEKINSDNEKTSNDERIDDYDTDMSASDSNAVDYIKKMQEKIEEIYQKLINGDTEVSYQIGAESMTEKEWDMLLAKFDAVQEDVKELAEEKQEKLEEEDKNSMLRALTSENSMCWYNGDAGEKTFYITCYTAEGIFCRKQGQTEGFLWSMEYSEKSQYDMVTNFLGKFDSDDNLRFASHKNFWQDLLSGALNEDEFMGFWNTTNDGIPDYTKMVGDSVFIDRDKIKFAKYMNSNDLGMI